MKKLSVTAGPEQSDKEQSDTVLYFYRMITCFDTGHLTCQNVYAQSQCRPDSYWYSILELLVFKKIKTLMKN